MTVATLPADVMIGMLRKGETGNQILEILNVLVPDVNEVTSEEVEEVVDFSEDQDEVMIDPTDEDVVVMDPAFAEV